MWEEQSYSFLYEMKRMEGVELSTRLLYMSDKFVKTIEKSLRLQGKNLLLDTSVFICMIEDLSANKFDKECSVISQLDSKILRNIYDSFNSKTDLKSTIQNVISQGILSSNISRETFNNVLSSLYYAICMYQNWTVEKLIIVDEGNSTLSSTSTMKNGYSNNGNITLKDSGYSSTINNNKGQYIFKSTANQTSNTSIQATFSNDMKKKIIVLIVIVAIVLGYMVINNNKTASPSSPDNILIGTENSDNYLDDVDTYDNDEYSLEETACSNEKYYNDSSYIPADGEIFYFGTYEQDGDCTNGTEPIQWITLNIETGEHKGETLLVSRYVLDVQPYNLNGSSKWSSSDLRNWLNDDFYYTAFNSEERNRILNTFNYNNSMPVKLANGQIVNTYDDDTTTERVVIFRASAIDTYVAQNLMSRAAKGTPYAWSRYYGDDSGTYSYENMAYSTRGMYDDGPYVTTDGKYSCSDYYSGMFGVRPAIFIE